MWREASSKRRRPEGEHVVGAPADGFGAQPFLLGQPENRGADQAFVEFQRFEQADQAAQPDAAAARQDGVAEGGDDQRAGLDSSLLAEGVETLLGGVAHDAWRIGNESRPAPKVARQV
jgi:hypothetical protein